MTKVYLNKLKAIKNKRKWAFTLLEIMVVIALMWILAIWVTNLNFNSIWDKQRLDWFFYEIKTNIETIKNNALIWREIKDGSNVIIWNKWQIDFSNSGSGIIKTYYYNWSTKKNYPLYDTIPEANYEISFKNSGTGLTSTWSIIIEWKDLILDKPDSNDKKIEVEIKYKASKKTFNINGISWVIEE